MKAFEIANLCRVSHETKEGTFVCYCPAHKEGKERTPSLYITQYDGKVGMHCFAGCTYEEVTKAIGITPGDLFDDSDRSQVEKKYTREDAQQDAILIAINRASAKRGETIIDTDTQAVKKAAMRLSKNNYLLTGKNELIYDA